MLPPKATLAALVFVFICGIGTSSSSSGCEFPSAWRGSWFHSGFPQPLNITSGVISEKGTCFASKGSHYLVKER